MVSANGRTRKMREPKIDDKYRVVMVPLSKISPCPENDDLYGEVEHDEQMDALIASIEKKGLEEPLILTRDYYILSGHRRYYAVDWLGWETVPCRVRSDIEWSMNTSIPAELAEYNPQRIKSVGSLLKEALLRDLSPEETYGAIQDYKDSAIQVDVGFMAVEGCKAVRHVSKKKMPFLMAAKWVIDSLKDYWPLSIRQIHYNLLNDPPLISTPKRSSKPLEHYRYRNDQRSYDALVELLKMARYHGHIPMHVIDDPTRPQLVHNGFNSVSQFVTQEVDKFLVGYHRDRQDDQARHIEIFCEKNTVYGMLSRVAKEYYVPIQAGRGFCSIPVWRNIAKRFKESGRKAMTLIIVSDYDPEGLELADDAIRSLRDLWKLPVEGHRVAVNREQIDELKLAEDFNPAKQTSSQFEKFVERTGDTKTWELESLPPDYLLAQVRAAIEANLDMDIFNRIVAQERADADKLWEIKQTIAGQLRL
jgi:hypothetical protein